MREIYFDNAATTRVRPEVAELMLRTMTEDYGNPSARHILGMKAERYIRDSREQIAKTLRVDPGEIYFTSGGTESNNLALLGTALSRQKRGRHIISTGIEHAAIYKPLDFLRERGFEVIAITASHDTPISKLADVNVVIKNNKSNVAAYEPNYFTAGALSYLERVMAAFANAVRQRS